MANLCENTIFVHTESEENYKYIWNYLKDNLMDTDLDNIDSDEFEGYFNSKWTFPEDVMEEMTNNLPDKECYTWIRVLSVEYGCLYHVLNVYDSNGEDSHWQSV